MLGPWFVTSSRYSAVSPATAAAVPSGAVCAFSISRSALRVGATPSSSLAYARPPSADRQFAAEASTVFTNDSPFGMAGSLP